MITKSLKHVLKVVPNVGRGLGPMVFNALLFYMLNREGDKKLLLSYSWFLVNGYFMITVTGWGLRDYMLKDYSQNMHAQNKLFTKFLASKLPLIFVTAILALLIGRGIYEAIFLLIFVIARTFLGLLEPLALVNKKIAPLFAGECIVYSVVLMLLLIKVFPLSSVITLVGVVELLRFVIGYVIIRPTISTEEIKPSAFLFLNDTRLYFLVALFSFCMSRVDAFILGFYKDDVSFSHYNIILSLVSASQIVIAAIYGQNIKSVFKLKIEKVTALFEKITWQFMLLSGVATVIVYITVHYIYAIAFSSAWFLLVYVNLYCFCLTVKYLFILNHINKPKYFLYACIFSSLVNIMGSLLLIPEFGMAGALISNSLAAFTQIVSIRISLRKIGLDLSLLSRAR
jgi:O-antigen/teichoic acid export membrane protein